MSRDSYRARNEAADKRYIVAAFNPAKGDQLIRRRRGPGLMDSAEAEMWAQKQEWYPFITSRRNTIKWWCWTVRR